MPPRIHALPTSCARMEQTWSQRNNPGALGLGWAGRQKRDSSFKSISHSLTHSARRSEVHDNSKQPTADGLPECLGDPGGVAQGALASLAGMPHVSGAASGCWRRARGEGIVGGCTLRSSPGAVRYGTWRYLPYYGTPS